jgi:hypothetical protein
VRRRASIQKRTQGESRQSSVRIGGWLRKHWVAAAIILLLLLSAGAWYWPREVAAMALIPARAQSSASFLKIPEAANTATALLLPAERAERQLELTKQLELADHTLCSYRDSTKYPSASRPIAEHPDQVYPNRAVEDRHAMRKENGGTDPSVQILTTQSRVFLAAGEAVAFSLKAVDSEGKTLPVFITRAIARGVTFQGSREVSPVALPFADDGKNGDAVAGDGMVSNVFAPDQTGFAHFDGTIRTEVKYSVGDRAGVVLFDVIYSPDNPATWSGSIREAVEGGSLHFYMKANVRIAGRYIVTGRVDDAQGKPFALVTFNDLLPQGSNEVRLTVFGKLMHDQKPALPLTLRDVDGYLLKENSDPDRALMPRLEGTAHVTKTYPMKNFSDAEWQSEERSRYLTEFGKDVELAKQALLEFDPEQAKQPFPQSECTKEQNAKNKAS